MDHAQERRLFVTSLLLSAGLHLALAGLGVMTGWGRTLTPPAVLEVKLVGPVAVPGGAGPKAQASGPASGLASPAPKRAPPAQKKILARLNPAPAPAKAAAPTPAPSLALAVPPRPPSPGSSPGGQEPPGGAGPGGYYSGPSGGLAPRSPGRGDGSGMGHAPGDYLSLVRARILARRHYPPLARQRQQEGVVRVRFRLSPSGALHPGVEVVRPSGFQILDEQARQCVLAAAPFPPFPRELNQDHLTIEVPIVYKLTEEE